MHPWALPLIEPLCIVVPIVTPPVVFMFAHYCEFSLPTRGGWIRITQTSDAHGLIGEQHAMRAICAPIPDVAIVIAYVRKKDTLIAVDWDCGSSCGRGDGRGGDRRVKRIRGSRRGNGRACGSG